jgi:hypothetical protein
MANDYQQAMFWPPEIDYIDVLGTLETQRTMLAELESGLAKSDEATLHDRVGQLDFRLIRYACRMLGHQLSEAAVEDGVRLLTISVMDPVDVPRRQEGWSTWLRTARCRPTLVAGVWESVRRRSATQVGEQLKQKNGVDLNGHAGQTITVSIRSLSLADVMSPDDYRVLFPESDDEDGNNAPSEGCDEEAQDEDDESR